jgi:hypothetical protein
LARRLYAVIAAKRSRAFTINRITAIKMTTARHALSRTDCAP